MNAQHLFLYAIIQKKQFNNLKPEYIQFFTDDGLNKILEVVFMQYLSKEPITEKTVINVLSKQPFQDAKKQALISIVHDICSEDRYMDYDYVKALKDEYYTLKENELVNILVNKKLTPEIKANNIIEYSDMIRTTRVSKDLHTYDDQCEKIINGMGTEDQKSIFNRAIDLTDGHLINIFGKKLYPQFQMITARPNDCKTTLAMNLASHLDSLGRPGVVVSWEDEASIVAIKILACRSGEDKSDIFNGTANVKQLSQYKCCKSGNIFIFDQSQTTVELQTDINYLISCYNLDWIIVDYVQRVKLSKGQDRNTAVAELADGLLEINKQHGIPVIALSQVPKTEMTSTKILGLGDEKGAGELAQNSRFSLSINPSPDGDKDWRLINRYKTTFDKKCQILCKWHLPSGQIEETRVMDA